MDAAALYRDKGPGYFGAARLDLLEMLAGRSGLAVLEVGAGDGATLRAARAMGIAGETVGVDLAVPAGGAHGLDRFIAGDVERLELGLPREHFDVLLCADVLEHLVDPWGTLARLAGFLRPGGLCLASIPNVQNHRALRRIVRGDFRYEPAGLLDRSHLRFFGRRNVIELFHGAGLAVEAVEENMGGYGLRHKLLDRLTAGLLHDYFVFQFRVRARKP